MATTFSSKQPREACVATLRESRHNRTSNSILPSEVKIIDRLLAHELELVDAYDELHGKLGDRPPGLSVFFDCLVNVAAFSNPEANAEARKGRDRLVEVNRQIAKTAAALSCLLSERTELQNHSGFSCDTHYHPIDLIHEAARENYIYQSMVKDKLERITGQYDLKYWPELSDIIEVIADDAERAVPRAHDEITDAGTDGQRPALAGTFRAFFVALEENCARSYGFLPSDFQLTDRSVASLISCALDLGPERAVDAQYVKRLRQRQRLKGRDV